MVVSLHGHLVIAGSWSQQCSAAPHQSLQDWHLLQEQQLSRWVALR
jgi:hypothetical protein